jgi:hypothetical protein
MARSTDPAVMRMGDALEAADVANVHTIDEWDVIAAAIIAAGAAPPPAPAAAWDVLPGTDGALTLRHRASGRRLKPSTVNLWGPDPGPILYDMARRLSNTSNGGD